MASCRRESVFDGLSRGHFGEALVDDGFGVGDQCFDQLFAIWDVFNQTAAHANGDHAGVDIAGLPGFGLLVARDQTVDF